MISPSVSRGASSACASSGSYTLTASQRINTSYVSMAPVSWTWYTARSSAGPYSSVGQTNASTYAISAPTSTGSIWYRYAQKVNFSANSTLETKTNAYTIGTNYCSPNFVYISQCCTALGSNPTFSATQVGDRSVTLTWSGMSHVDHFVIRYGTEGGITYAEKTVSGTSTSTTINNLTNGHTYYFQIQAIGASGSPGFCDSQLSTKITLTPNCN